MEWKDEYLTGNTMVDAQHKQLFEMAAHLKRDLENKSEFTQSAVLAQLNELANHMTVHFSTEEFEMQRMAVPAKEIEKHTNNHKYWRDKILKIVNKVRVSQRLGQVDYMQAAYDLVRVTEQFWESHWPSYDCKMCKGCC